MGIEHIGSVQDVAQRLDQFHFLQRLHALGDNEEQAVSCVLPQLRARQLLHQQGEKLVIDYEVDVDPRDVGPYHLKAPASNRWLAILVRVLCNKIQLKLTFVTRGFLGQLPEYETKSRRAWPHMILSWRPSSCCSWLFRGEFPLPPER